MILIGPIKKTISGIWSQLSCPVSINDKTKELWFKVHSEYADYLCDERADAQLIAVLHFAIKNGHDIKIEAPVSETLLFNIETYLIPALVENNPSFHRIKIQAPTDNTTLPNASAVGTGISCGVDSLHVLAEHTKSKYSNHNVTHLTFNNVGSHGIGEKARELYQKRLKRPREFANEYGFTFIESDSNLTEVIDQSHFKTHTYSSMFPIFCLQKLYSKYYYASSGYKFREFNLKDKPESSCGAYELLSLQVFSTPQLHIYSEGMGLTRLDKLTSVVKYTPAKKYLNVCLVSENNCGVCEKCVRTLLGIDTTGQLNEFRNVFDIDHYTSNKKWYLQQLLYRVKDKKHDYFEMYPYFKNEITLFMHFKAFVYSVVQKSKRLIKANQLTYSLAKKLIKKSDAS